MLDGLALAMVGSARPTLDGDARRSALAMLDGSTLARCSALDTARFDGSALDWRMLDGSALDWRDARRSALGAGDARRLDTGAMRPALDVRRIKLVLRRTIFHSPFDLAQWRAGRVAMARRSA